MGGCTVARFAAVSFATFQGRSWTAQSRRKLTTPSTPANLISLENANGNKKISRTLAPGILIFVHSQRDIGMKPVDLM
jgi:hypothetical protein